MSRTPEADRTQRLRESLPNRIVIGEWSDKRAKKFFVRHGPRHALKLQSFESERERNDAAEKLAEAREEHGAAILDFDPEEWRRYRDFRTRCPAPFAELERLYAAHRERANTQLVREAIPRYMQLRLNEDLKKGNDSYRHIDLHLRRLAGFCVNLRLDEITADFIRDFLTRLKDKKGKPVGDLAKRTHRKDWNTFFKRCVVEEWCTKNPCANVVPPKVEKRRKPILTPEQAFRLFKTNAEQDVIGRLALEAFGGFRASSAERLRKDHIKWENKGLELTKDENDPDDVAHKSGVRKYREGHPPVLWAWLTKSPEAGWTDIDRNNYGHRKGGAFLRANVTNTGNVLRHSFASYLLALSKSYQLVGYLMQHTKPSTTEIYEGAATADDARLYFSISPEAVRLEWPEFRERWREFYREAVVGR